MEELLERGAEIVRRLPAQIGLLRQRAHDDLVEVARHVRPLGRRRRDVGLADLAEEPVHVLLEVQHLSGQHLVDEDARREDVGPDVDGIAPGLLRRHVIVLALDDPDGGLLAAHGRLGDAEVDDLHLAGVRQEDVLRRDVAVDDAHRAAAGVALAVRVVEAGADLLADIGRGLDGHDALELRRLAQDLEQIAAVDVLHRDVVGVADLAQVEDVRDVHVLELDRDLGLVDQHLDEVVVRREVGVDHLQGHDLLEALQALGRGEVDLGHAAGRDLREETVGAELSTAFWLGHRRPRPLHAAFTPPDCAGWCAAAWPGCTNTPTRRSGARVPRSNVHTTSVAMPWATFTT